MTSFISDKISDFYQSALFLAKQGNIVIISRERAGQFGRSSSSSVGQGLARRGVAMIRTLYKIAETDTESVLYNRVRRAFCAYGYSLGGGAVQDLRYYLTEEDGLKCLVPMHTFAVSKDIIYCFNLPPNLCHPVYHLPLPLRVLIKGPICSCERFSIFRCNRRAYARRCRSR